MQAPIRMMICCCLSLCSFLIPVASQADIVKDGFTFADNAFADEVVGAVPPLSAFPCCDVVANITDTSLATGVGIGPAGSIDLAFTDNIVVNNPGTRS